MQVNHPIFDPLLTAEGRTQAENLAVVLQQEIGKGMKRPQKLFVSPLRRTAATCLLEWSWLPIMSPSSPRADTINGQVDDTKGVPAIAVEVGNKPFSYSY